MKSHDSGYSLPQTGPARLRNALLGKARDLHDPSIHHKLSLIAFLAWVGLGADGLSSSCYGPEEAFRALGEHRWLALVLVAATSVTIFVISYTYSKIIEQFPHGGGGYIVATNLLGEKAGVVSGCALLVDYILTITVSVAGGGDALFSLLPISLHSWKVPVEYGAILILILMNLRGLKESVSLLIPVFLLFIATHVVLMGGGILFHLPEVANVARSAQTGYHAGAAQLGALGLFLVFLRAYSLGGGTYTGIEAVSNAVGILREPRVETGKRTMLYMALSLSLTAGGLLFCYLLINVQPIEGQTLNAVLANALAGGIKLSKLPVGAWFVTVTMASEAVLLLVAAQTGFIDGPRVMSNMASDSWLPRRFSALSNRLTMQNGILLIGVAALGLLAYTQGSIQILVVMYSINVFVTFTLSQIGMMRHWLDTRKTEPFWKRRLAVHAVGFILCFSILLVMAVEKFTQGAWVTVLITASCIALCICIRRHYHAVAAQLAKISEAFKDLPILMQETNSVAPATGPRRTAAMLVGRFDGPGMHLLLSVLRLFPNTFNRIVFISVGVIDSAFFKDEAHVEQTEKKYMDNLNRYVDLARKLGFEAEAAYMAGTDVVASCSDLCLRIAKENGPTVFFAGELLFEQPRWFHRFLHNETAYAIQQQIRFAGLSMVIMPLLIPRMRKDKGELARTAIGTVPARVS